MPLPGTMPGPASTAPWRGRVARCEQTVQYEADRDAREHADRIGDRRAHERYRAARDEHRGEHALQPRRDEQRSQTRHGFLPIGNT